MMERTLTLDCNEKIGETVKLLGWVQTRRDHGKICFVDLRDRTGVIQVFMTGEQAGELGTEDVVEVIGKVAQRPEKLVNDKIPTGKIEIQTESARVLSKSKEMPIPVDGDGYEIDELIRYRYRYLDLKRSRLQKNFRIRHKIVSTIHHYLDEKDFVEIETPYLSKTTPEGARDFLVPSRHHKGTFYALTQSPQQYKQLLMIAGFERYYQIARAFRDEDLRADRQYEHTQLDVEMSFVKREDILNLIEGLIKEIVKKMEKTLTFEEFPRLTYQEVMEKYGSDKPDLRKDKNNPDEMAFAFVVDFPLFERNEEENRWTFSHNPFTSPDPQDLEKLEKGEDIKNINSLQYDLICNGFEMASGSIRITDPKIQKLVFQTMGFTDEEIQSDFGHILEAYTFGAPVHGGIAIGIDRLTAVFTGETSIREVVAFPVSSHGQTSVMEAPSSVNPKILNDLGLLLKTDSSK